MALLRAILTTLLFLSAAASTGVTTPHGSDEQGSTDIRRNFVEPYEGVKAVTSRRLPETFRTRTSQGLAQTENVSRLLKKPQARTLSVFLGGEEDTKNNQAATTSDIGDIAPLNDHPLWKVHKYQGVDLSPVLLPTGYGPPSDAYVSPAETYGPPAETYGPPTKTYAAPVETLSPKQPANPSESYSPPTETNGPPVSSSSATPDTSAALSALDNLSGLVSLLPEDGQENSPSVSALTSLASLLPQKSNSGLSLEQLSALASVVSLLRTKASGASASTYGTPNTQGADLSTLASLVSLLPRETATSSGSLLARLQSLLKRRPNFLNRLLNVLNSVRPSKNRGTNPDAEVANLLFLPDLPPILIPANYKFQETGLGRPYIVKYSKSVPTTLLDSSYGPPPQEPLPSYEATVQPQQGVQTHPPLQETPKYGTPVKSPTTFETAQEASSFQSTQSNSQQYINSFFTPAVLYTSSVQEPVSAVNSYGQPTAQYRVIPPVETDKTNSNLQTQSQNQFYNNAAQASATDSSVSQSVYSVPEQSHIQPEVQGPSVEIGTYQFAQSGPYPQQSYPPPHSDLYTGTSRSDTNIPSNDVPSEQDDFRPSTLAAATGSGYSRVAFQRSQQQNPHHINLVDQPDRELDLVATSTSNVSQLNGDIEDAGATVSHALSQTSPDDSEHREENVFHPDQNKFQTGNRSN